MAAPPVRKSGSGAGMLFLGLAIGIVLMAGVGAVLYFMPMRNIANIIKDEPVDYSSSSSSSHGTISKPSAPDTAAAAEDAEDQGQMGEDGPVTIEYDKQDAQQVMAFLVYALFEQQPEMLGELVSPIGCVFVPYATEVEVPGEFNGEEIVAETRKALVDSDATCLGYSVTKNGAPDKATIYWLGLNYDWAGLGLADYAAPTTAFEFFKGDDGWELSFISPVPDDLAPSGDELKPPPLDFMPAGE